MSLPHAAEARFFYQAAKQRLEDAVLLLDLDRTTGAGYLAGYAVECMLKALILSRSSPRRRKEFRESFRGSKAHDFEWLKARYFEIGGPNFPNHVSRAFSFVSIWGVDFRYRGGTIKLPEAKAFIESARVITQWAEERM